VVAGGRRGVTCLRDARGELRGAEAVDTFVLCPTTCDEVQASEGEIELRLDCEL
jgi:hypothetical protein